jgi:beta-1,4-mannooligosaccharide/beta-1,4-mannosyl-N-acetylglucosamine phosphorylase
MLKKSLANPILTTRDIPAVKPVLSDVSSVFNPAAVKFKGKIKKDKKEINAILYGLILRVQTRGRETFLMRAQSEGGIAFDVDKEILEIKGLEKIKEKIYHVYDPRITTLDGKYYMVFAADLDNKCCLGIAESSDFKEFKLVSFDPASDTRNGVLFPEKIKGRYLRLERPNKVTLESGVTSGSEIVLSSSDDLKKWAIEKSVMKGRHHYWDELIGSGPPPVKTKDGWLHIYHGVATHFQSVNIYQAGVVLLDLKDPSKVIARSRNNILEPREDYELTGQVPNVVFPSGMIVEDFDSKGFAKPESLVRIYYGAADTSVCYAFTTIQDLMRSLEN